MFRASRSAPRSSLRWLATRDAAVLGGGTSDRPMPRARASVAGARHVHFQGGGIKGMEGYFKQEKLREKVEQMRDARAKAERYASAKETNTSRVDEPAHPPPWEAPPPPLGVHAMAEAEIARAMRSGVLENLPGKGKPLASDPSTETPWEVDAGRAALNRVLKVAGYKPRSVEASEKVRTASLVLETVLAKAVRTGEVSSLRPAAGNTNIALAYEDKANAVKKYNSALIVDSESYGSGWPLMPAKIGTLEEHARDAMRLARAATES
jgi:hypothetical protein